MLSAFATGFGATASASSPYFEAKAGGGGGSRTPVRKYSTVTSTCLAQVLKFRFSDLPGAGYLKNYPKLSFAAVSLGANLPLSCFNYAPFCLTGVDRWHADYLSSQSLVIIVCDYILFYLFNEPVETSTCS